MKKFNIYEAVGKIGKAFRENGITVAFASVYAIGLYLSYWIIATVYKIKKNTSKILEMLDWKLN